jgi:dTMP kinase
MRKFETYGGTIPGLQLDELKGWLIVIEGTDGVGRTTHVSRLRTHLERLGYAVAETGLMRSGSEPWHPPRQEQHCGHYAFSVLSTDFADRLEHQILSALRAGFVMLTDRYVYSLIARGIVRGANPEWIKQVYSFSLKPDAVYYLRIGVPDLVPRVLVNGGFDYWESGMDIPMGEDLYDSFIQYQERVIRELDALASEYHFETLDATTDVDELAEELCQRVTRLLESDQPQALESVEPA